MGDVVIRSCSSDQQGDSLGPLGFTLMLHPVVETIKSEVPNVRIITLYLVARMEMQRAEREEHP